MHQIPQKMEKENLSYQYKRIVSELWKNEEASEFKYPVDFKALNLNDYPLLIKIPMDLNTIKKKIRNGKYKSPQDFMNDVDLIWDNCRRYNQETSLIFWQANKMEKIAKKLFKKYLSAKKKAKRDFPGSFSQYSHEKSFIENENKFQETISFDEKVKLCQTMKNLNENELKEVIKIIDEYCPNSIQESNEDKFFIKVEDLNSSVLQKIYYYLSSYSTTNNNVQSAPNPNK